MNLIAFRATWETASERKRRLFACACCRWSWHLIVKSASRDAVEAAEGHVEGLVTDESLGRAASWAEADVIFPRDITGEYFLIEERIRAAGWELDDHPTTEAEVRESRETWRLRYLAAHLAEWAASDLRAAFPFDPPFAELVPSELIGEVFGDLSRPVELAPEWRTPTAVELARTMYAARDFAAMPVLADALEDAGCDSPAVLAHCRGSDRPFGPYLDLQHPSDSLAPFRQPGWHVRGCWVVDLVLGRANDFS